MVTGLSKVPGNVGSDALTELKKGGSKFSIVLHKMYPKFSFKSCCISAYFLCLFVINVKVEIFLLENFVTAGMMLIQIL